MYTTAQALVYVSLCPGHELSDTVYVRTSTSQDVSKCLLCNSSQCCLNASWSWSLVGVAGSALNLLAQRCPHKLTTNVLFSSLYRLYIPVQTWCVDYFYLIAGILFFLAGAVWVSLPLANAEIHLITLEYIATCRFFENCLCLVW